MYASNAEHYQEYRCQWIEKSEKLKLQSNFSEHVLFYGFPQKYN